MGTLIIVAALCGLKILTLMATSFVPYPPLPVNPWELTYGAFIGEGEKASISHTLLFPEEDNEDDDKNFNKEDYKNKILKEIYGKTIHEKFPLLDESLDADSSLYEGPAFKEIKEGLQNLTKMIDEEPTRRHDTSATLYNYYGVCIMGCWYGYYDEQEVNGSQYEAAQVNEQHKIYRVKNLTLAFLIHARYRVRQALTIRGIVKDDKRYRLGYLFNRLRRLMYDQRKIYGTLIVLEESHRHREFMRSLQGYKMLLRLEVDIRNVIDLIKRIYYYDMDPKVYVPVTLKTKKPKSTKPSTTTAGW